MVVSPEGATNLCITIGYETDAIVRMLQTQYDMTEDAARDLVARSQETRLSANRNL